MLALLGMGRKSTEKSTSDVKESAKKNSSSQESRSSRSANIRNTVEANSSGRTLEEKIEEVGDFHYESGCDDDAVWCDSDVDTNFGKPGISPKAGTRRPHRHPRKRPIRLPPGPTTAKPLSAAAFSKALEEIERGLQVGAPYAKKGGSRGEKVVTPKEIKAQQLLAAQKLKDLLSSDRDKLIEEIMDRNWVPLLIGWLWLDDSSVLQMDALWAMTNIAAGTSEQTHVLLKHGAITVLIHLLASNSREVVEQSLWVLGNLAGEGVMARDAILTAGALAHVIRCIDMYAPYMSMCRIGSWVMSNLFDGQPRPQIDAPVVLPSLSRLLACVDGQVLSHTCWALSHLCDGPSIHIKAVVDAKICLRLVDLLSHRSWKVTKPALRTIGNIVCAEDEIDYTQYIMDAGAVPYLRQLIMHSTKEVQKEACWTLSNIAAGTIDQIQVVIDSGAIPHLVSLATSKDTDPEVKSEVFWVILNATSCGSDSQIEYIVSEGCVPILCELLCENSMVLMALEGLERVLQVGDIAAQRPYSNGVNPFAHLLSPQNIETLESHKNTQISRRASRIWKLYFVTCAICSSNFSRHSSHARFCDECQCHVCVGCDCEIFHLSYQEQLWDTLEVKEKAKSAARKSRKAKKKLKMKEKKSATTVNKQVTERDSSSDISDYEVNDLPQSQIKSNVAPQVQGIEDELNHRLSQKCNTTSSTSLATDSFLQVKTNGQNGKEKILKSNRLQALPFDQNSSLEIVQQMQDLLNESTKKQNEPIESIDLSNLKGVLPSEFGVCDVSNRIQIETDEGWKVVGENSKHMKNHTSNIQLSSETHRGIPTSHIQTTARGTSRKADKKQKLKSDAEVNRDYPKQKMTENICKNAFEDDLSLDGLHSNDKLVSYLQQTGSILKLAELLDEEDRI